MAKLLTNEEVRIATECLSAAFAGDSEMPVPRESIAALISELGNRPEAMGYYAPDVADAEQRGYKRGLAQRGESEQRKGGYCYINGGAEEDAINAAEAHLLESADRWGKRVPAWTYDNINREGIIKSAAVEYAEALGYAKPYDPPAEPCQTCGNRGWHQCEAETTVEWRNRKREAVKRMLAEDPRWSVDEIAVQLNIQRDTAAALIDELEDDADNPDNWADGKAWFHNLDGDDDDEPEDGVDCGGCVPVPELVDDHDCKAAHVLAVQLAETTKAALTQLDDRVAALEIDKREDEYRRARIGRMLGGARDRIAKQEEKHED